MELSNILLVLNIFISILHPLKHIPQIIHTMETKKVEDLSKTNILCELGMNVFSTISCVLAYYRIGKQTFFLPVVIEKATSTVFICIIYHLKKKYTRVYTYEEIKPINQDDKYQSINV